MSIMSNKGKLILTYSYNGILHRSEKRTNPFHCAFWEIYRLRLRTRLMFVKKRFCILVFERREEPSCRLRPVLFCRCEMYTLHKHVLIWNSIFSCFILGMMTLPASHLSWISTLCTLVLSAASGWPKTGFGNLSYKDIQPKSQSCLNNVPEIE